MKTDQIVAHGHAVIKQPLAYMGKTEPSLAFTLTIDALPLHLLLSLFHIYKHVSSIHYLFLLVS